MAASFVSAGTLKEALTQLRALLDHIAVEYNALILSTRCRFAKHRQRARGVEITNIGIALLNTQHGIMYG